MDSLPIALAPSANDLWFKGSRTLDPRCFMRNSTWMQLERDVIAPTHAETDRAPITEPADGSPSQVLPHFFRLRFARPIDRFANSASLSDDPVLFCIMRSRDSMAAMATAATFISRSR